jgi:hypothetical protein
MHRVAVDVAQFLYSLRLTPDIEIVVTRLPERQRVAGFGSAEECVAVLTAEGDEVQTASFWETGKTPGHGLRVDSVLTVSL